MDPKTFLGILVKQLTSLAKAKFKDRRLRKNIAEAVHRTFSDQADIFLPLCMDETFVDMLFRLARGKTTDAKAMVDLGVSISEEKGLGLSEDEIIENLRQFGIGFINIFEDCAPPETGKIPSAFTNFLNSVERLDQDRRTAIVFEKLKRQEIVERDYPDAESLKDIPLKQRIILLINQLGVPEVEDQVNSARLLGYIGPQAKAAIPALIEKLKEEDELLRSSAEWALREIGPSSVPSLIRSLKDKDIQLRRGVLRAFKRMGNMAIDAVPALIEAVKDKDIVFRKDAVAALGHVTLETKDSVPHLIKILKDRDQDVDVRLIAALALGHKGPGAKAAVPALIEALKDKDLEDRFYFAVALGQIGREAKAAVPDLIKALKDNDIQLRREATWALTKIGCVSKEVVTALNEALKDEDESVRELAEVALKEIRRSEPFESAEELIRHLRRQP